MNCVVSASFDALAGSPSLEIVGGTWFLFTLFFRGFADANLAGWLMTYVPGSTTGLGRLYSAIQYSDIVQLAVLSSTLVLGVWMTFRLLRVPVRRVRAAVVLGAGVSLTLASLAYASYYDGGMVRFWSYGFPLGWFGWINDLGPPYWGVSAFPTIVDVLFWTGVANAGLRVGPKLRIIRHDSANEKGANPSYNLPSGS